MEDFDFCAETVSQALRNKVSEWRHELWRDGALH